MTEARRRTLTRYLVVGAANTAIGLGCIYASQAALGLGDVQANLFGYSVAVLFSFVANRAWTFRHEGRALAALARFLLVLGAAYLANLAAVITARDVLGFAPALAQLAGIAPYTAVGYLGSRWFAFAGSAADPALSRQTSKARSVITTS
jgi:putative flippase GtrA